MTQRTLLSCFILAAILVGCSSGESEAPRTLAVQTELGAVEGYEADGVYSYRGIPYAAPPVGELRWRPPAAP